MSKAQWMKENLRPGEIYAGLILGKKNEPDYHLIAMPVHKDVSMTWDKAMKLAESTRTALPNRRELSLLLANCKEHFNPTWYWSCEQYAGLAASAWCQTFSNGGQYGGHKGSNHRVVLVRRVLIGEE